MKFLKTKKRADKHRLFFIGIARFELTTFCSQSRRSTRLSYIPSETKYNKKFLLREFLSIFFVFFLFFLLKFQNSCFLKDFLGLSTIQKLAFESPFHKKRPLLQRALRNRDEWIRTIDHLNPIQVLYQTELHPDEVIQI